MPIPIFRPTVKRKDMGSVLSCIVSDRIGPGEITRELVQGFSHLLGMAGGTTVSHSYLAFSLALESLGLQAGDAVVLSALSPSLHVRVARDKGLIPLLADVDPETGSLDPKAVEKLVARGPKAIVVVHTSGIIADVEALKVFGAQIVEDCSQSLGGKTGEILCGSAGDAVVISMAPEDIVTCGGGAVVLMKSRNAASQMKRIAEASPLYSPLADMNAALGISQLHALDRFITARREIHAAYTQSMMKSRHKFLRQKGEAECVLGAFPVVLADGLKDARQYAMKKNVETIQAFTESAVSRDDMAEFTCPNARSLMLRCLLFPLYPMMGRREVETVQKVLATLP
jgi:dTDP-4-amino-4,6-dideoxygalactose transaminase